MEVCGINDKDGVVIQDVDIDILRLFGGGGGETDLLHVSRVDS